MIGLVTEREKSFMSTVLAIGETVSSHYRIDFQTETLFQESTSCVSDMLRKSFLKSYEYQRADTELSAFEKNITKWK